MAFRLNSWHGLPRQPRQLRSLVGEAGYTLEKAPNRGCWFLIGKKDGKPAVSDRGTTAFNVKVAIQLLERLSVDATPGDA